VAEITLLLSQDRSSELVEWLSKRGVDPGSQVGRPPTVAEVREAVAALGPVEVDDRMCDGRWQLGVRFGPVTATAAGAPHYAGGFELTADLPEEHDGAPALELSARGGDAGAITELARRLAAVAGPLVLVAASDGEPVLIR
jgi:hypothetical protein